MRRHPSGGTQGPKRDMGEKVSEAPEPVPRGCSGHGAGTLVSPAAAVSSEGASSAESSSGSETLSEEGEPGRFSCRSQPPRPPGGALGTPLPAAWAPARVALERGVPTLPLPPPGGAVLPVPRVSSASKEEQDEEVGSVCPIPHPPGPLCRGPLDPFECARLSWIGEGTKGSLPQPGIVTVRRLLVVVPARLSTGATRQCALGMSLSRSLHVCICLGPQR